MLYVIVDLETRTVLTDLDNARLEFADEKSAYGAALMSEGMTDHPHAIVEDPDSTVAVLRRMPAPWFVKPWCDAFR